MFQHRKDIRSVRVRGGLIWLWLEIEVPFILKNTWVLQVRSGNKGRVGNISFTGGAIGASMQQIVSSYVDLPWMDIPKSLQSFIRQNLGKKVHTHLGS